MKRREQAARGLLGFARFRTPFGDKTGTTPPLRRKTYCTQNGATKKFQI
jgi:hypothetical protein